MPSGTFPWNGHQNQNQNIRHCSRTYMFDTYDFASTVFFYYLLFPESAFTWYEGKPNHNHILLYLYFYTPHGSSRNVAFTCYLFQFHSGRWTGKWKWWRSSELWWKLLPRIMWACGRRTSTYIIVITEGRKSMTLYSFPENKEKRLWNKSNHGWWVEWAGLDWSGVGLLNNIYYFISWKKKPCFAYVLKWV